MNLSRAPKLLSLTLLLLMAYLPSAHGRTSGQIEHSYKHVWPAAVRLLRVDMRLKVSEKDRDSGYVLFEYKSGDKSYQGSLELLRTKNDKGQMVVKAVVTIHSQPAYVELRVISRLQEKLRREQAPPPSPAPKSEDADKDEEEEKSA